MRGPRGWIDSASGCPDGEGMEGPKGAPVMEGELPPLNVDRTVMREVLTTGVEGKNKFGVEFEGYEITSDGVEVPFSDGTTVMGCLLVGADGVRSRVKRQLVPDDVLLDTQGRFLIGKTALTAVVSESFNDDALKGTAILRHQSRSNPLTLLPEPMHLTKSEIVATPDEYYLLGPHRAHRPFWMDDSALLKLSSERVATLAECFTSHRDAHSRLCSHIKIESKLSCRALHRLGQHCHNGRAKAALL